MSPLRWDVAPRRVRAGPARSRARAARRPLRGGDDDPPAVVPRRRLGRRRAAAVRQHAAHARPDGEAGSAAGHPAAVRGDRRTPDPPARPSVATLRGVVRPAGVLQDSTSDAQHPESVRPQAARLSTDLALAIRATSWAPHVTRMTDPSASRRRSPPSPRRGRRGLVGRRTRPARPRRRAAAGCAAARTSTRVLPADRAGAAPAAGPRDRGRAPASRPSSAISRRRSCWGCRCGTSPLDRVHVTRRPRAWNDTSAVLSLPRRAAAGRRGDGGRRRRGHRSRADGAGPGPVAAPSRRQWSPSTPRCTPALMSHDVLRERDCSTSPGTPGAGARRARCGFADGRSESVGESAAGSSLHRWKLPPSALQFEIRSADGGLVGRTDFAWEDQRARRRVRRADQVRPTAAPGPGRRRRGVRREAPRGRNPRRGLGGRPLGVGGPARARTGWPRGSAARGSGRIDADDRSCGCCSRSSGSCRAPTSANNTPRSRAVRAGGPPASR